MPEPAITIEPGPYPTMADACPEATEQVTRILRRMDHGDLAESLPTRPFYGRCACNTNRDIAEPHTMGIPPDCIDRGLSTLAAHRADH